MAIGRHNSCTILRPAHAVFLTLLNVVLWLTFIQTYMKSPVHIVMAIRNVHMYLTKVQYIVLCQDSAVIAQLCGNIGFLWNCESQFCYRQYPTMQNYDDILKYGHMYRTIFSVWILKECKWTKMLAMLLFFMDMFTNISHSNSYICTIYTINIYLTQYALVN